MKRSGYTCRKLMIRCPKCGFEQNESGECARCGVIFAKLQMYPPCYPAVKPVSGGRAREDWVKYAVLFALVLVLGLVLRRGWMGRDLRYTPGVLVNSEPQQLIISNPVPWVKNKRVIVPLARFSLKARVLSKEKYRFDHGADISPIDLALGWGPMSDQKVLDQLEIAQGDRFFVIAPVKEKPPLPMSVLLANSSNMHILPANAGIEKSLALLRIGELVELGGYLVGVRENGQWTWVSSLSRLDTGDGACEIFWVERVEFLASGKRL